MKIIFVLLLFIAFTTLPSHLSAQSSIKNVPIVPKAEKTLFIDVHELGAGNVTAAAVAGAHQKDLAVQGKYGVSFINYWVDEKRGIVMCLAEAKDSNSLIQTHTEAHGLIPTHVMKVKQGE